MRFCLDEKRNIDIFTRYVTSRHEEPFEYVPEDPFIPIPAHIEYDPNIVRRQDQLALGAKYCHKLSEQLSWDASLSIYDSTSRFMNGDDDGSGIQEFEFTAEAQVVTARLQAVWNLDEVLNTPDAKSRILLRSRLAIRGVHLDRRAISMAPSSSISIIKI